MRASAVHKRIVEEMRRAIVEAPRKLFEGPGPERPAGGLELGDAIALEAE